MNKRRKGRGKRETRLELNRDVSKSSAMHHIGSPWLHSGWQMNEHASLLRLAKFICMSIYNRLVLLQHLKQYPLYAIIELFLP